jgi:hypothetical protein
LVSDAVLYSFFNIKKEGISYLEKTLPLLREPKKINDKLLVWTDKVLNNTKLVVKMIQLSVQINEAKQKLGLDPTNKSLRSSINSLENSRVDSAKEQDRTRPSMLAAEKSYKDSLSLYGRSGLASVQRGTLGAVGSVGSYVGSSLENSYDYWKKHSKLGSGGLWIV